MTSNYLQDRGHITLGTEAFVIHDKKVLMQKRAETKKNFPGWWTGPGGHVDVGEDILTAAIREVEEETGIKVNEKEIQLKSIALHYHLDRSELFIIYIYRATISNHQDIIINEREGKSEWIPIEKLCTLEHIFPPSKYYFEHVLGNESGILYTNIEWSDSRLVRVLSHRIETRSTIS